MSKYKVAETGSQERFIVQMFLVGKSLEELGNKFGWVDFKFLQLFREEIQRLSVSLHAVVEGYEILRDSCECCKGHLLAYTASAKTKKYKVGDKLICLSCWEQYTVEDDPDDDEFVVLTLIK